MPNPSQKSRERNRSGMRPAPSNPRVMSSGICARGKLNFSASTHWRWKRITRQMPNRSMAADAASHCRVTQIHPSQGSGAPWGSPIQKLPITRGVASGRACQGR